MRALLVLLSALLVTTVAPVDAEATCGDVPPPTATIEEQSRSITASDALAVLQSAVGTRSCAVCVCDVNDSGSVTAADALAVLRSAVGQPVTLHCPGCSTQPDAAVLAAAYCDYLVRCEPVQFDYRHWTSESCTTTTQTELARGFEAVGDAIEAGRTEFVAGEFEACLAAYEQIDCDRGIADECRYLHGKRSKNQGCSITAECADDLFCDAPSPPACGACHERAATGEDCSTKVCVAGAECLEVFNGSVVCVANDLEVGAPCGTLETGLCRGQLDCAGPEQTCLRPAKLDETCDISGEAGANCSIYQKTSCVEDTCVELVVHTAGGVCNEGGFLCDVDSRCDFLTSKCVALPGSGQTCAFGLNCASGLYCGGNGKCAPLGGEGDACVDNAGCQRNLFCSGPQGARTCAVAAYGACP